MIERDKQERRAKLIEKMRQASVDRTFPVAEEEESWTIYMNGTVTNGVSAAERDAADRQVQDELDDARIEAIIDAAALVFNSLAEYKAWAAGASTQERHAYWDALSEFDWQCLWDDLDDEAAAQEPAATKPEEK